MNPHYRMFFDARAKVKFYHRLFPSVTSRLAGTARAGAQCDCHRFPNSHFRHHLF